MAHDDRDITGSAQTSTIAVSAGRTHHAKADEWRRGLVVTVSGLLVFETLTGLSIYVLPFSISNQIMVLAHTGVGLVFLAPLAWYQIQHWRRYRDLRLSHVKLTGYFALAATIVALVQSPRSSGIILIWQTVRIRVSLPLSRSIPSGRWPHA